MSVNPELQGRSYTTTSPYLVGREKVREFALAVYAENPLHHDPRVAQEAGYLDVVAPPTFAVVLQERALALLLTDPDAGIDFSRVVHGEQGFSYHRAIVAGDELTASLEVTRVAKLGTHAMISADTAITDSEGGPVLTAQSTLVVRGGE